MITRGILGNFVVHQLSDPESGGFLTRAARDELIGGRIYDAHIAEIARLSGARTVITGNVRHFKGLSSHGIAVLSPSEVELQG